MEMPNTPLEPVDEDWSSALAIVAHPDDLEFGSASAIARWTAQGKRIVYLLATRGEAGIDGMVPEEAGPLREQEERDSARIVGVDTVEFLDFPDGVLEYGLPLRHDFAAAVRRHKPEIVITGNFQDSFGPGMLNQADHIAVGRAVLDAVRDAGNRWVFRDLLDQASSPGAAYTRCSSAAHRRASTLSISTTTSRRRAVRSRPIPSTWPDWAAAGHRRTRSWSRWRECSGLGWAASTRPGSRSSRSARPGEPTRVVNRARRRRPRATASPRSFARPAPASAATSSQSGSDASSSCTPPTRSDPDTAARIPLGVGAHQCGLLAFGRLDPQGEPTVAVMIDEEPSVSLLPQQVAGMTVGVLDDGLR